jgi:hypothetical protein
MMLKVPKKNNSTISDSCCEISCREQCQKSLPENKELDIRSFFGWATGQDMSMIDNIWLK